MRRTAAILCVAASIASQIAQAAPKDKYHVTPAEKAACTQDAIRLCMDAYPDEDKLLACMRSNRASLSPTCQVAFDAGMKRRRL